MQNDIVLLIKWKLSAWSEGLFILYLIIYMKKFLHSDRLRAVQFFLKQCRKVLIQCKKR